MPRSTNIIKTITLSFLFGTAMTGGLLTYATQVDRCKAVVLSDLSKQQRFTGQLSNFVTQPDFITAMTKGH